MQRKKSSGPARKKPTTGAKGPVAGKKRPTKKKAAPVKRSLQRREAVRIRWDGLLPDMDALGREIKRPYKLESLQSAVARTFERRERTIEAVIEHALGSVPISSLSFTFASENDHRLVFQLSVALTNRKRGQFAFVIAKRDIEKSELQRQEHENLRALHLRMPKHVLRPYRSGILFIPDRHGRSGKGRQLYWYLTQTWGKAREVHVGPNGQFLLHEDRPRLCSSAATDSIRAAICEAVVRSYDPAAGTCLQPPIPLLGEYIAELPAKGKPRVFPVTCRRLAQNVNPVKLIDLLAGAGRSFEDGVYQTIPENGDVFFDALARALGPDQAEGWLQAYAVALSSRRIKEKPGLPAEMLRALLAER